MPLPSCVRGLFIIDDKGILRQITMNDLPVCNYSTCDFLYICFTDTNRVALYYHESILEAQYHK